jgi:hypothetical protein
MTAVSGAVAQSYEAKVFDVPASWEEDETPISAADLPEDFVQITKDEAKALAVPDGDGVLIYGFKGDKVKIILFESGTFTDDEEAQEVREVFRLFQTEFNGIICYTAAAESIDLTTTDNLTWALASMPVYDVELEVEYETDLALNEVDDNTAKLDEWNGYQANVTLTRTLQAGSWNTLALPFNLSIPMGWTVKELSSASLEGEVLTLNFTEATSIQAGKPYLVKVATTSHLHGATFSETMVSSALHPFTSADVDFVPTLGKTLVTGPTGDESNTKAVLFLATGNQLVNPTVVNDTENASSYIKGFRAYFQVKGQAAEARSFALNLGGDATGIVDIKREPITNNRYYDLQGRKVSGNAAKKGVYVVNGKKVVK